MVFLDHINKYEFINTFFAQLPSPAMAPEMLVDIFSVATKNRVLNLVPSDNARNACRYLLTYHLFQQPLIAYLHLLTLLYQVVIPSDGAKDACWYLSVFRVTTDE